MKWSVAWAVLVSVMAVLPAAAQTTATPGRITFGGVVTLGSGTSSLATPYASSIISSQPPPSTTARNSGSASSSSASAAGSGSADALVGGPSTEQGVRGSRSPTA